MSNKKFNFTKDNQIRIDFELIHNQIWKIVDEEVFKNYKRNLYVEWSNFINENKISNEIVDYCLKNSWTEISSLLAERSENLYQDYLYRMIEEDEKKDKEEFINLIDEIVNEFLNEPISLRGKYLINTIDNKFNDFDYCIYLANMNLIKDFEYIDNETEKEKISHDEIKSKILQMVENEIELKQDNNQKRKTGQ
ncbi:MAG: hypothetical protein ACRCUM_04020 [Mycoplasmoidaceae bacterium]